jgi:glycosyltransferase involved in cell wall biosynthesis
VAGLVVFHTESSLGWGGQELRILGEMEQLRGRGHACILVAQPAAAIAERAASAGFPVHRVRMRNGADLAAGLCIAGLLRRTRPDLVVTHSSCDAWVGGLAARWVGLPVVRTRHLAIRIRRDPVARRVYTWLADRIVATGEEGRQILIAQAGVPAERVAVIPTGVDTTRFDPGRVDRSAVRRELGLGDVVPLIGIVAVVRERKGHPVLLEALAGTELCRRGVHLLVAGAGPMQDSVEAQAQTLGLGERVHFLGHREDVPEVLAACDIACLPSLLAEGVPQAILQAFALARPVVASDVPGIRQIVRPMETGLLVPPGNPSALGASLVRLLDEPDLARRLAEGGRALAMGAYSIGVMADRVEALYRDVVSTARGSGPDPHSGGR